MVGFFSFFQTRKKYTVFFNLQIETRILGWMVRLLREWAHSVNSNVCAVNWSRLARYSYSLAAKHTRVVGRYVGVFVQYLNRIGVKLDDITLAGHSMGGQICGFAGAYLNSVGLYADTIIGMDLFLNYTICT